jgi:hypothetical protein
MGEEPPGVRSTTHLPGRTSLRKRTPALCALLAALLAPTGLVGQVVPDTLPPPPDTLPDVLAPDDSLAVQEVQADTLPPPDSVPAVRLQELARPVPALFETGVWEWDRDGILGSRAITLAELLAEVPGIVLVRGGDYGSPVAVSAFGAGGGRVRVYRDGMEILPMEGSVADISRIGLGGLTSVRVARAAGELRIELTSILADDGRPYSLVEAGTGDLNTNLFRGTFAHPRAFGGVLALSMDRIDTQGPQGREPGSTTAGWVRYARPLWGGGVAVLDYSSRSSDRGTFFDPAKVSRSDWSVRTRWSLLPGLVGDLHYASSSLKTEEPDTFPFGLEKRTQLGALLGYDTHLVRALAGVRKLSGEGLPSTTARLEAEGSIGRFGGLAGEVDWEKWEDRSLTRNRLRAWTAPLFGLSLFAETGRGEWGLPYLAPWIPPPPDPGEEEGEEGEDPPPADTAKYVLPGPRFAEHAGSRLGLRFQWRGLDLAGARLRVESDSLFPTGLPLDRSGETTYGGIRDGFELSGRIPAYLPGLAWSLPGLALVGSYQWWDQAEEVASPGGDVSTPDEFASGGKVPWRYLPRQSYRASVSFHDTFFPTENLEIWFDLGVQGRDPMVVPFPEEVSSGQAATGLPAVVPFYQSWFVRLQIRVVTVRAFIMWENFTVRQRNQDIPGRIFPATRSLYGVRWTMWN